MADEPVIEPVVAVVEPEPVATEPEPQEPVHPLTPGGPRFEEVYGQMKDYRREAEMLRAEKAAWLQQQRPQQGPVYVDPAQLQALVDQGRMTPMQAADVLSKQNAQQAAAQYTIAATQAQQLNAKITSASQEVNQYIDKMPMLRDNASSEFIKVRDEAYRLSDDMGLPVQDFRVQRAALRATFGSLERIASATQARAQSRDASLPHTESGGGRGPSAAKPGADPLKDIDPAYVNFWKSRGYTEKQMLDEAQYIPKGRKVRTK